MRLTRSICAVPLIMTAACSASLTAPPSGLPVTLTSVLNINPDVQVPSITGAGDSVVAVVMESGAAACGGPLTAAAGLRAGELVMTLTQPARTGQCPPVTAVVPLPLKVVVQEVPSGTRTATVVLRVVRGDNATYSTLASGTITVQ